MSKLTKSILECLLGSLLVLFFGPLLSPMTNPWYQIYSEPLYWLFGSIGCGILTFIIIYFIDINPRKFYYCINVIPVILFLTLSTLCLIPSIIYIAIIENIVLKISLLILLIFMYLFLIYAFIHRGICIYKNKIRIFKFKIKTYNASKIENIKFEHLNKKCNIIITINDLKEEFVLSSFSAKMIEKRMCELISYKS
jgi:hypothetical protein